jgi:futalosine hydrolase
VKPVVITAATPRELGALVEAAGGCHVHLSGGWECREGWLSGKRVVIAATGLGKVNTAGCIVQLLSRYNPTLLVNVGCGGAYPGSALSIGEIAVASREIYGDEGVLAPDGWQPLDLIGIPLWESGGDRFYNVFELPAGPAEAAVEAATSLRLAVKHGPFITVSSCSGTDERGDELGRRFGAICENMEGAAAAHLAARHGVDLLEFRGISNIVERRDISRWDIDGAIASVQKVMLRFLEMLPASPA